MEHIEDAVSKSTDKGKKKKNDGANNQKWAILSISSIPLVMTLGNSMLIPVLPAMEKELSISSFQVSMIITVYSIVAIFLIPIAGYLSDHIGRKKVIIPSLLIAGIGGIISGWAAWKFKDPYWVILIGRALQGVGAAGASPIVMPLVGDMFKNDDDVSSSLGLIETSNTFGKVLSPILGALLAGIFWFLPFFSIPVFCAISIILMLFLVKTPKKREKPIPFKQFFKKVKETFTQKGKWLYAIFAIGAILMFALFGVLFYLSDVLEKTYHIKDIKKGLLLAVPLSALCASSFITGKLIKENKKLMKWITFCGCALSSVAIIILSFSDKLWFLIVLFLFSGIGIGVALPCLDALITEGIEKEERGTISSIYSSMRFIGVAAGPPVVAVMLKQSDNMLFYLLSGLILLAALATLFAIKPGNVKS
ncbi:MFS transporter [Cytobacillus purgationiresistens]|uniref:ACDE family multidrug resistance protein n=1 Tax=Cytobacillus purgationiresistens TaxID=863449 RepID=A0ABU0AGI3_9BACI|nr:MFS transporter [Cytobacillus purgationiresistens]MDQ0270370.1 ACDE family multidrug resistance protein [Cytobacillus purgationiresistens]